MPGTRKKSGTVSKSTRLSARTKKQIDLLPEHAQEIYKKAHANALEQYQKPEKRRGGKRESAERLCFLPCDLYCNLLKLYVQNNTMSQKKTCE